MFATIYTDASKINNDYGYSYYTKCNDGNHGDSGLILDEWCCDINYAEMYCIVKAIEESIFKFNHINRILVVTDSQVAQYTLWTNYRNDFLQNGYWDSIYRNPSGSKKNKYKNIVEKFLQLENNLDKIMIKWTKGHRSDYSDRAYLNNKCDEQARKAIINHRSK